MSPSPAPSALPVHGRTDAPAYVNEEGLLEGMPTNPRATLLLGVEIVGPALLCGFDPRRVDFFPLESDPTTLRRMNGLITERVTALGAGSVSVKVETLSSKLPGTSGHIDLAGHPSCGVLISVKQRGSGYSLALTSDLPGVPEKLTWPPRWRRAMDADALLCHVSTIPLSELRKTASLAMPALNGGPAQLNDDISWINDEAQAKQVKSRLDYAYWLAGDGGTVVGPVGDSEALEAWQTPKTHPYLAGLLKLARSFAPAGQRGLFIVGELSEELGSFRSKIATELNKTVLKDTKADAVTADIGLRVVIAEPIRTGGAAVRIMCSTCDLDNDAAPDELFHEANVMTEVCVKGENEGIFYYCDDHEPGGQPDDPMFVEKHERYDVFGR